MEKIILHSCRGKNSPGSLSELPIAPKTLGLRLNGFFCGELPNVGVAPNADEWFAAENTDGLRMLDPPSDDDIAPLDDDSRQ